jgi:hypothetical protein
MKRTDYQWTPDSDFTQIWDLKILEGKTIKRTASTALNCLELEFTDGTKIRLEAEGEYEIARYKKDS